MRTETSSDSHLISESSPSDLLDYFEYSISQFHFDEKDKARLLYCVCFLHVYLSNFGKEGLLYCHYFCIDEGQLY